METYHGCPCAHDVGWSCAKGDQQVTVPIEACADAGGTEGRPEVTVVVKLPG